MQGISIPKFAPANARAHSVQAPSRNGAVCANQLCRQSARCLDAGARARARHSRRASSKEHSVLTFHSALPLAETASVFAEMILNERLLQDTNDPAVKRDILARIVDDAYATVMRQAFFAMFEKTAHDAFANNATADEVSELVLGKSHDSVGDALEVQDDFKWEWVVIHHFYHVPFYVYADSFGQLLTLALYKRYRRQGEAFKPNYFKILAVRWLGVSQHILEEAGIDITSAEFWQGGFDMISGIYRSVGIAGKVTSIEHRALSRSGGCCQVHPADNMSPAFSRSMLAPSSLPCPFSITVTTARSNSTQFAGDLAQVAGFVSWNTKKAKRGVARRAGVDGERVSFRDFVGSRNGHWRRRTQRAPLAWTYPTLAAPPSITTRTIMRGCAPGAADLSRPAARLSLDSPKMTMGKNWVCTVVSRIRPQKM